MPLIQNVLYTMFFDVNVNIIALLQEHESILTVHVIASVMLLVYTEIALYRAHRRVQLVRPHQSYITAKYARQMPDAR